MNDYKKTQKELTELNHDGNEDRDEHGNDTSEQSKLTEKEKQNALNEVRILASVKSSFVVCYKEAFYDETEQCLGIVMEFADKGDLYQKISEFKRAGVSSKTI
mgnify:CR=1 FL=1